MSKILFHLNSKVIFLVEPRMYAALVTGDLVSNEVANDFLELKKVSSTRFDADMFVCLGFGSSGVEKNRAIFYDENLKEALSTDQKFVSQAHKYVANNVCLNFSLF